MPDTLVVAIVDDLCQKQQEPENWEPNISTSTTYREHLSFISEYPLYLITYINIWFNMQHKFEDVWDKQQKTKNIVLGSLDQQERMGQPGQASLSGLSQTSSIRQGPKYC